MGGCEFKIGVVSWLISLSCWQV